MKERKDLETGLIAREGYGRNMVEGESGQQMKMVPEAVFTAAKSRIINPRLHQRRQYRQFPVGLDQMI